MINTLIDEIMTKLQNKYDKYTVQKKKKHLGYQRKCKM